MLHMARYVMEFNVKSICVRIDVCEQNMYEKYVWILR